MGEDKTKDPSEESDLVRGGKEREGRRNLVFVLSVSHSHYCVKATYNGTFYCMTYRVNTGQMFDSK